MNIVRPEKKVASFRRSAARVKTVSQTNRVLPTLNYFQTYALFFSPRPPTPSIVFQIFRHYTLKYLPTTTILSGCNDVFGFVTYLPSNLFVRVMKTMRSSCHTSNNDNDIFIWDRFNFGSSRTRHVQAETSPVGKYSIVYASRNIVLTTSVVCKYHTLFCFVNIEVNGRISIGRIES